MPNEDITNAVVIDPNWCGEHIFFDDILNENSMPLSSSSHEEVLCEVPTIDVAAPTLHCQSKHNLSHMETYLDETIVNSSPLVLVHCFGPSSQPTIHIPHSNRPKVAEKLKKWFPTVIPEFCNSVATF